MMTQMNKDFIAKVSTVIHASTDKVWEALTNPDLIKRYLFGTEVLTDWKVGNSITYKGIWQGKTYEDKGKILEIENEKRIVSTYWSSMGGKPDKPENYNTVAYELTPEGKNTKLTITQDNIATETEREHSEKNWTMVLDSLKALLQK